MGCATKTIKYALIICTTIWAILGVLSILFGGFGWGGMPRYYAIGAITLGGIMLLISLFGCMGAIRESARSLWLYAFGMLLLLIMIIVFICYNSRDVFKKFALEEVNELWRMELEKPGAMDNMQRVYSCCGRTSAEDYNGRESIPSSCCRDNNCINPTNVYLTGCLTKVEEAFADEVTTTQIYEWCLFGFNIVILLLSIVMALHYTNQKRRYDY